MKNLRWFWLVFALFTIFVQTSTVNAKETRLSALQKKQLESLLSSVANADTKIFNSRRQSNTSLIKFGIIHSIRNNQKVFVPTAKGSEFFKLAPKYVDAATSKFFGKKISKHQSVDDWKYKNGYYIVSLNEAEGDLICQVTKITSTVKGVWRVSFNIFDEFEDRLLMKKTVIVNAKKRNSFTLGKI